MSWNGKKQIAKAMTTTMSMVATLRRDCSSASVDLLMDADVVVTTLFWKDGLDAPQPSSVGIPDQRRMQTSA